MAYLGVKRMRRLITNSSPSKFLIGAAVSFDLNVAFLLLFSYRVQSSVQEV